MFLTPWLNALCFGRTRRQKRRVGRHNAVPKLTAATEGLEDRTLLSGLTLEATTFYGGAGDQQGQDVEVDDGTVYASVIEQSVDTTYLAGYSTGLADGEAPLGTLTFTQGRLYGIDVDGGKVYAAGYSLPSSGITVDGIGGSESKGITADFNDDGTAGAGPSGSNWAVPVPSTFASGSATSYYSYGGHEGHEDVTAADVSGTTYIFAAGTGQSNGSTNTIALSKYDTSGTFITAATSSGHSLAHDVLSTAGQIYAAGYVDSSTRPTLFIYDTDLVLQSAVSDTTLFGRFHGMTEFVGDIVAVGHTYTPGMSNTEDYLIQRFDTAGNQLWSSNPSDTGVDVLYDVIGIGSRLFAVGYTTSSGAGGKDLAVLEIDPSNGNVLETTLFGDAQDDGAFAAATDGNDLYVLGESRSFAEGGNTIGQNDAVLLRFSTATTTVEIDGMGNLVITDSSPAGQNDDLTIEFDSGANEIVVSDPGNGLIANVGTLNGPNEVRVPLASVTGSEIVVNALGGDDSLTVDASLEATGLSVEYAGDAGSDSLALTGTAQTVTHTFTNANDGSVDVDTLTINYTGLEPIADNVAAVDRVFDFGGSADDVTIGDDGTPDNGISRISSVSSSESVDFVNPSGSLTVNAGDGNDTISLEALDDGPRVTLFSDDAQFQGLADITTDGVTGFYVSGSDFVVGGFDSQEIFQVGMAGGAASIFSAANNPNGVTTDGTYIYWIDPNGDPDATAIFRRAIAGGPVEKIYSGFATGQPIVDGSGLEFVAGSGTPGVLVSADFVQGQVHSMNATNPVSNLTQIGPDRYGGFFDREHLNFVDVEGGIIYVADSGHPSFGDTPPRVQSIPLAGGSFTDLFVGTLPDFSPDGIEVVGDTIYLTNGDEILHMPTSGGTPTVFVADSQFDSLRGLTFFDGALYAVDSPPGSSAVIWKIAVNGLPTEGITINGDGGDDTLVVKSAVDGVTFHGGPQGGAGDSLEIDAAAGPFSTVTYTAGGKNDGSVDLDGSTITYTGLEPIVDDTTAADRVFTIDSQTNFGDHHVHLADDVSAAGRSLIESINPDVFTGFESVSFANPTNSLTINTGDGYDFVWLESVDAAFAASVVVNTERGNDHVSASFFSQAITATTGDGNDTVFATPFADALDGGEFDDYLVGDAGNDTILGGEDFDTIEGGDGNDLLDGGDDNDTVWGDDGDDTIQGGAGYDILVGDEGADSLVGGPHDDSLHGEDGNDTIEGGDGFDRIFGGNDNDLLLGQAGNDAMEGDAGNDTLDGGTEDDWLDGGEDNDSLLGGEGFDRLRGNSGDDTLEGGTEEDSLLGGIGDDLLDGGEADDFLNGNANDDTLLGGDGDDRLFGGGGMDALDGGTGNDRLNGQGGDDTLTGGVGDDRINGSTGNDRLVESGDVDMTLDDNGLIGLGNDSLQEIEEGELSGGDSANYMDAAGFSGNVTLNGGIGADTLYGGSGDDSLVGDNGFDILNGRAGKDTLDGGNGNDGLSGMEGDDFINGGSGGDTILGGDGNDTLLAGGGNDIALGENGVDKSKGQGGVDTVAGGGNGIAADPNDTVIGDTIDDAFVFDAPWVNV